MDENPQSKGPVLHVVETVAETIDHLREGAAGSLDSAAATARATATRLDSTAEFIRDFSVTGSLRALVRRSPGLAVGIGVGAGLLVGLALRRSPARHEPE